MPNLNDFFSDISTVVTTISNIFQNKSVGTSPTLANNKNVQFSTESSDMKALMRSNGIYDRYQMDWYKKFSRFGIIDPYNTLTGTKEYIFITKPDLCILNSSGNINRALASNAFFIDAVRRYKDVAAQLQSSYSTDGPFISMLSNSITSTLDMPGINADMIETAGNITGTRISYRGTSIKSDQDHDFSLEFEDTKYLDVYMLFKMYDEYEKLKWRGLIDFTTADGGARWVLYTTNKILHDQVSIYKFIVSDDGSRIVYWARITGCVPVSIPRESFSDMKDSVQQKITVGWKGHFVRDMDPIIIHQFNSIVTPYISQDTPDLDLFDMESHAINGDWASMPYIEIRNVDDPSRMESNRREYFLKWKK